jgi:putative ABC transport system permease protein
VFAVAALALSALGLYGVIAGNVAERTREIGLRAALGATRLGILTLVMHQGMKTAVVGLALGLLGAGILARNLEALLYRTGSLDPATFIGVAALLCAFCAVACLLPAWRAAQLDPTVALRSE